MNDRVYTVLMAGGSGTRFWPLSRRRRPKQVLPIAGDIPMIRVTVDRLGDLVTPARLLVVTGADQADAIRETLSELPEENLLLEPAPRNTAPCIGLGAVVAADRDPDALLLCLPADHVIEPAEAFRESASRALSRADSAHTLVTFGIPPRRPATGYGYIRVGEETAPGIHRVATFVEKPDLDTARGYVTDGAHLWNSGMFAWRADAFLSEVEQYLPDLSLGLTEIGADRALLDRVFPRLPAISVDYGVMEQTDRAEVVIAEFSWDDVGSFDALGRILPADAGGNRGRAALHTVDSTGLIAMAPDGHLVAVIGVDDLVIVATDDVTLVCPRDRAQEVKALVDGLSEEQRSRYG